MKTFKLISNAFIGLCCLFATEKGLAQNVGISATSGFTPDASAGLDISYTNKGLLVPRVALTATNAAGPITSPAISLLVYNTVTAGTAPNNVVPGYYYWNGVAWMALNTGTASANSSWATIGNIGTAAGTNFIGTTDAVDFVFKTNNLERARFTSTGNFGVGSTAFNATNPEQLLVDAGTSSFNVISGKGNLNNYLQLNIQNINAGTTASSDVVATADNGNETTNYVDMGINSSANTSAYFGAANDAYLYNAGGSTGGNFFIGTSTAGKSLGFLTGGGATTNERMRIDGTGNVGIGNAAPTQKLDITGNLKLSGAFMPNNNAGTAGYFLVSSGAGAAPIWYNATSYINTAAWLLAGNPGTNPATSFIGTTDAQDFVVRTNNTERTRVTSAGNVGIGTTTPAQKLDVNGSINAATSLISQGSVFVDYAITNTGALSPGLIFGGAGSGESISSKRTSGTNQYGIDFYTAGASRMSIANGGNVGIGNNVPTEKLDVTGNLKFSGALMPNNNAGTAGYILQSAGAGTPPVWVSAGASQAWSLTGNTGTTAGTNFIGTTDATDFVVNTNNTERARISSTGSLGVGTSAFDPTNPERLLIDAGTTTNTAISTSGTINDYFQFNIQNLSNGTAASTDIVATANNGTDNGAYIDMGINSNAFPSVTTANQGITSRANTAYIYANAGDMVIGNGAPAKPLIFFTNNGTSGQTTAYGTERMRIDQNGFIGIGATTSTINRLSVAGNVAGSADNTYTLGSSGFRWSNIYYTAATQTSDRRMKTNIKPLKYGLKEVLALKPVSYNWKKTPNTNPRIGLIAQDVRKIVPEVVNGDEKKETLGMNYAELVSVLINAVKEQQKEIDDLKKAVQKLQK